MAKVVLIGLKAYVYTSNLAKSGPKRAKMGQKLVKMSQNWVFIRYNSFLTCFDVF